MASPPPPPSPTSFCTKCLSFQVNPGEYILAFYDCAFVEYFPVGESRARGGFHHHRRRRPSLASLSPLLSTPLSARPPPPPLLPSQSPCHPLLPLWHISTGGGRAASAQEAEGEDSIGEQWTKKTQGNKLLPHFPGSKLKVRKVGGGRDRLRSKRQDTTERGEGERKAVGTERERKGGRGAFNFGT